MPFYDQALFKYRQINWQLKFCWLPQTCMLSGQRIWLKYAYCGTRLITGPGEPVVEKYWHSRLEHLIWVLKHD